MLGDKGMGVGADMITFNSQTLKVSDKVSAGYQYPSLDETEDIEVVAASKIRDNTYAYF